MSNQPGAADVICNAQEVKMRPVKTELSGLMNPYRGAAVGMDYHYKGQTHTYKNSWTHTHKCLLKRPFVYLQLHYKLISQ